MKTLIFLLCTLPTLALAQPGYINTVACGGGYGYTGDGGPATAATMGGALGVAVDLAGNIYFPDQDNGVIRKVNAAGIITTFAGGGGSAADGIAATSAGLSLSATGAITIDRYGNVIFAETYRVRKVTVATGIISTIAGSTTAGYTGDGGPATAATFSAIFGVFMTHSGELYITDQGNSRIRKVNSSGIIRTVAGCGLLGFTGDGGPATAARLDHPAQVAVDTADNLYITDCSNNRIRKVNTSGIITTFAGNGSTSGGDGGPATAAGLSYPSGVCVDNMGNVYIADFHSSRVRVVNRLGTIVTMAGNGSGVVSMVNDIPATSAGLTNIWTIGIDNFSNIYIPEQTAYCIRRVETINPTAQSDSFFVFVSGLCAGPSISISPVNYSSSLHVQTWFGDGTSQTDTFSSFTSSAVINHNYNSSGTYSLKYILYNGSTAIDTIRHSYVYTKCTTIPVKIYYDNNGNCIRDSAECSMSKPIHIAVDSNGVRLDTIHCISGMYYKALGSPGDIYTFRTISSLAGLSVSCPVSGAISDTIVSGIYANPSVDFGFSCDTTHAFNLGATFSIAGTGRHTQAGEIYAYNLNCPFTNAVVTLYHSPKYAYDIAIPAPSSTTSTSITWNLSGLTNILPSTPISYSLEVPSTYLMVGDTVHSKVVITPSAGDADTTNNVIIRTDTVRSSYDPNFIESTPSGHIYPGTTLRYTVGFENDGNDTARNIYVLDTISGYFDAATLRPVFASHEMYIEKLTTSWGTPLYKFDFPNIKLLDSTHHGLCEGTFQYDIKVKNGLPDCTRLPARVGIYFDDNPVVLTNTFTNVIGCIPASVTSSIPSDVGVTVYPNPASDVLNIKTDGNVFESYTITNSVGSTVWNNTINSSISQVNIKALPAGLYFVNLKGSGGNVVKKFVKM